MSAAPRISLAAWLGACMLAGAALVSAPAHGADGDDGWGEGFGWPGVDDIVYAMTVYHGDLIAGGRFRDAGGVAVECIARWDGVSWHPLGDGIQYLASPTDAFVSTLTVFDDQLIVGGHFSYAGGVAAINVARWDGSGWAPLGPGLDISVQSLGVVGGALIAGGEFQHSGTTTINRIARWDGAQWLPLGAGLDDVPWALVEYDGALIAGGAFTQAGGGAASHLARWDGSGWSPLGAGTSGGLAGTVTSLAVFRGELIAAGYFTSAGGAPASGVAAWDGSAWRALDAGVEPYVLALTVRDDRLYAGGDFGTAGGIAAVSIASWDGAVWSPLATRTGRTDGSTSHMVVFEMIPYGSGLAVAGDFDVAQEMPAVRIAGWDGSGWYPLGRGLSDRYYLSWVSCFARYDDRLIIGGRLAHGQNGLLPSVDIRAWDGTLMSLFEWRVSAQSTPSTAALAVHGDDLFAAGSFTSMGGVPASFIARWDGAAWQPLGSGADAPVEALAVYGGELIAGGSFTQIGGVIANHVARWDGAAWHAMGAGTDGTVTAFATLGADLIVGGYFTQAGGQPANYIARWDGGAWAPVGAGTDGPVRALAVYQDVLFAGGLFTSAGGFAANHVARWDSAGWSALGLGTDDDVTALAILHDRLIAGGYFNHAGGIPAESIARWDGATWSALGSGLSDPSFNDQITTVFALEPSGDTLYVGGRFELAGDKPAFNVTTWTDSLGEIEPPPPPMPPAALRLEANRPNPFSTSTTFRFALPTASRVRLTLHDLAGRRVATILDDELLAGQRSQPWIAQDDEGRPLESGIYFVRLAAGGTILTRKIAIVR